MIYEDETSEQNKFIIKHLRDVWQEQVPIILSEPILHFNFSNCYSQPSTYNSTFVLTFASCSEKLWEKQFIALSLSVPNLPQLFLNILKLFT